MIDSSIAGIVPPLIAAVLTYIAANKKSRLSNAKVLADVQMKAIEQVRIAEEKMRSEIWIELDKVRLENAELKKDIYDLRVQLESASNLRATLTQQVHMLERLVNTYKDRISELENKR